MPGYDPVEKYRDQPPPPPPPRTRKPGHGDYARKEKDYEPQTVPLAKDGVQMGFLDEPPRVEGYRGLTADEVMTPPLTVGNLP